MCAVRRKGRKLIQSKETKAYGITFRSETEAYMYKLLRKHKIRAQYEKKSFVLMPSFVCKHRSFERNKRKNFKEITNVIQPITYTPDFVGDNFIIEVKGRANEQFPLRWKLFKYLINNKPVEYTLFVPRNKKECDEVIKIIKEL